MPKRIKLRDFAFDPQHGPHHFVLVQDGLGGAAIHEIFAWNEEGDDLQGVRTLAAKAVVVGKPWSAASSAAAAEFNARLGQLGCRPAAWKKATLLAPYLGKELTLLMWAIEDAAPDADVSNAIANWCGFAPEERWWLYTTVNATSGHPEHGRDRGWRKAIKIAFTENPTTARPGAMLAPAIAHSRRQSSTMRKTRQEVHLMQIKFPLDGR